MYYEVLKFVVLKRDLMHAPAFLYINIVIISMPYGDVV